MQWKLAILSALLSIASAAQALQLDTPTGEIETGEPLVIGFQSTPQDTPFDLLIVHANPEEKIAVATDVPSNGNAVGFKVPCVGSLLDGWFLEAVSPTNSTIVFATTGQFTLTQGPEC